MADYRLTDGAKTSRLTELTNIIATETKKIEAYFADNGLPNLSFDVNAPANFPVPSSEKEIHAARRSVINATQELHDLMVGPRETVRWLAWNVCAELLILFRPCNTVHHSVGTY